MFGSKKSGGGPLVLCLCIACFLFVPGVLTVGEEESAGSLDEEYELDGNDLVSLRHLRFVLSGFPYASCTRATQTQTPYNLEYQGTNARGTETEHCFVVRQQSCATTTRCCRVLTADFHRIEVEVKSTCVDAVTSMTLDGQPQDIIRIANNPTGTVAISSLGQSINTVIGKQFCFRSRAPCRDLTEVCATDSNRCRSTITSNTAALSYCCPVQFIGPPPPPPECKPAATLLCPPNVCAPGTLVNFTSLCTGAPETARITAAVAPCATGAEYTVTATIGDGAGAGCTVRRNATVTAACTPAVALSCEAATCRHGQNIDFGLFCTATPATAQITTVGIPCASGTYQVKAAIGDGASTNCSATSTVEVTAACTPEVTLRCPASKCTVGTLLDFASICEVAPSTAKLTNTAVPCASGSYLVTAAIGDGAGTDCMASTMADITAVCTPKVTLDCLPSACTVGSTLDFAKICEVSPSTGKVTTAAVPCMTGIYPVTAVVGDGSGNRCTATTTARILSGGRAM